MFSVIRLLWQASKRGGNAPSMVSGGYWMGTTLSALFWSSFALLSPRCRSGAAGWDWSYSAMAASDLAWASCFSSAVNALTCLTWNNRRFLTLRDLEPSMGRIPSAIQRLKVLTSMWGLTSPKPAFLKARTTAISFLIERSDLAFRGVTPVTVLPDFLASSACCTALTMAARASGENVTGLVMRNSILILDHSHQTALPTVMVRLCYPPNP